MPDLWARLRAALVANPAPTPVDPDPPATFTVAGETWEQHDTRGCWHPTGRDQCHSPRAVAQHFYDRGWYDLAKTLRWWWSHDDGCGPTVGSVNQEPERCTGCGLSSGTWMRGMPVTDDGEGAT
jgi:hypothetical protein